MCAAQTTCVHWTRHSRFFLPVIGIALCMLGSGIGCKRGDGYQGQEKSSARRWIDAPTTGSTSEGWIKIPSLGVSFEIPETRYVFKDCGETLHTPEGTEDWIPLIRCSSQVREEEGSVASEQIHLTFYITEKTRPIDERAIAFYRNQYKQAGFEVQEMSYNEDYLRKRGIYTVLHVPVSDQIGAQQEIVQFMFPEEDVLFIARMEYPFGDTRSVANDWQSIVWNFTVEMP